MTGPDDSYTFESITKDPAESRAVELDLFGKAANYWRPNEQFSNAEYARPNYSTGFAYQATSGGTSGAREPKWPTTINATVVDGSITWTTVAAGANGLNAVSSPSAASSPTGLTISAVSVSETTKILATYSGGTVNQEYDAVFSFTLNGLSRIARQRVYIRFK
jgi:hypothetical protein